MLQSLQHLTSCHFMTYRVRIASCPETPEQRRGSHQEQGSELQRCSHCNSSEQGKCSVLDAGAFSTASGIQVQDCLLSCLCLSVSCCTCCALQSEYAFALALLCCTKRVCICTCFVVLYKASMPTACSHKQAAYGMLARLSTHSAANNAAC